MIMQRLDMKVMEQYVSRIKSIYGAHLRKVILYGSYARNEALPDSDVDVMILLDLPEMEIKAYRHRVSDVSFDFLMDYDMDIKSISKNIDHFEKWLGVYPFYSVVDSEGVRLYEVA